MKSTPISTNNNINNRNSFYKEPMIKKTLLEEGRNDTAAKSNYFSLTESYAHLLVNEFSYSLVNYFPISMPNPKHKCSLGSKRPP